MAQRLAAAEEALQEAALELEVKDGLLAQEDEREAALLEQCVASYFCGWMGG